MNKIIVLDSNKNETIIDTPPHGLIIEWLGNNGSLKFYSTSRFKNCKFQINDGGIIEVGENSNINNLFIRCAATESKVKLGNHFIISSGEFILALGGRHQSITIGDDCLFSSHVAIFTSDGHSIIDKTDNSILNNIGGNICIGKHCWIGYRSVLTKSARLPSNTIVGANALVSKSFSEEFCCVGGNPAKILKKNVKWSIKNPSIYKGV